MGKTPIHDTSHPFHTQTGRVYQGRLTYYNQSPNTHMVVIFHGTIAVSQPVSFYWQWGINYHGVREENNVHNCIVRSMELTENGYKLHMQEGIKMSEKSMELTMMNKDGHCAKPATLDLAWPLP
ncbi:hypothetical protein BDZ91DRAFT_736504 [Kalaharituber pfeilii]|nr:hypothetical protein BDZ91DRAFT_736504 [Kalaharituber pfeilii]